MSTACVMLIKEDSVPIVAIQTHADGYPNGRGLQLAKILAKAKIVNGIGLGDTTNSYNGAGCLAASLVVAFKHGIGGVYLEAAQEIVPGDYPYLYVVDVEERKIATITAYDGNVSIFSGDCESFKSFCESCDD